MPDEEEMETGEAPLGVRTLCEHAADRIWDDVVGLLGLGFGAALVCYAVLVCWDPVS